MKLSRWHAALTIAERGLAAESVEITETGRRSLERCKSAPVFAPAGRFSERLDEARLDEASLLRLLSEREASVCSRLERPAWAEAIERALDENVFDSVADARLERIEASVIDVHARACVRLVRRLAHEPFRRVESAARAQVATPSASTVCFHVETAADLFFRNVAEATDVQLMRTMAVEVNAARLAGELAGDSAEERFDDWVERTRSAAGLARLLDEYPVLGRFLAVRLSDFADAAVEVITRLSADAAQIAARFPECRGEVTHVSTSAGDTHRSGRSVVVLTFASGAKLVYKPHSVGVDAAFQDLLSWMNARASEIGANLPALQTTRALDRGTHGWCEWVEHAYATAPGGVARFYERQGVLLALLYAIEATDLHSDNVVATGEHPVVVDLEALFHPRLPSIAEGRFVDPAGRALSQSVQRIVLLPERIGSTRENTGIDISGMGFVEQQRSPAPVPKMQGLGSDVMRLVHEHESLRGTRSLPAERVSLVDHVEDVVSGFRKAYDFILGERDAFTSRLSPFGEVEVRVLVDDTAVYDRIVKSSFHPQYLRDARERERIFDRIHYKTAWRPSVRPLLASERLDLARGDVPYFSAAAGSLVVRDARGVAFHGVLEQTGLAGALARVARMSPSDRDDQEWFIRASFATVPLGEGRLHWRPSVLAAPAERVTPERLLSLASSVGERIVARTRRIGEHANWLGIDLVRDREWRLTPLGPDLYNGTPGVCLFLAYLGAVTKRDDFTSTARAALATILAQMKSVSASGANGPIGAFGELLSPAYVLVHLARIWNDPTLTERAHTAVGELCPYIGADGDLDLVSGSAGALASLVAIDRAAPGEATLEAMTRAARHLLASAVALPDGPGRALPPPRGSTFTRPLTGLSHGASGLAFGLLRFASVDRVDASLRSASRELARDALLYERSTFAVERANWPDYRGEVASPSRAEATATVDYGVTWCHGAPGIALARAAALADATLAADPSFARELAIATSTTLTQGFGLNHSLCHGDLGNLEALVTARGALDDELLLLASRIADSIERQGPLCGSPLGVETPGLMTGLAGIGLELLRLSAPARVPSVLTLDAPVDT